MVFNLWRERFWKKALCLKVHGLSFPLMYPSEKDGLLLEKEERLRWYFANESVWIDSPGGWIQESGSDNWMALASALKKARPKKPVDGVVLVVDINEILTASDQSIKKMASGIRSRIDELLMRWEVEVPVYLLFNKADLIPGFREFFEETGKDHIFGATLRLKRNSVAGIEFNNEYKILCKSLSDLRLERLNKEKNASAGRMICRFLIHFESIQKKLGYLAVELFRDSSYGGKPIFRGFYFTSCTAKIKTPAQRTVSNQTIINHPLNPGREFLLTETLQTHSDTVSTVDSAFVIPLFREIMVKDKSLARVTQKGFRRAEYSIIT
jgi:type VI secretion system protein ImpL